MLGLKLNRVGKRGHKSLSREFIFYAKLPNPVLLNPRMFASIWTPGPMAPTAACNCLEFMGFLFCSSENNSSFSDTTRNSGITVPIWLLLCPVSNVSNNCAPYLKRGVDNLGPFYQHQLTLILGWLSNCFHCFHNVLNDITSRTSTVEQVQLRNW